MRRKQRREQQLQIAREKSNLEISNLSGSMLQESSDDPLAQNIDDFGNDDNDDTDNFVPPPDKKGKYDIDVSETHDVNAGSSNGIPKKYCHIRESERKVREEIYSVMHLMSSKFHMSKRQIEGSILAVANILFGLNWKPFKPKGTQDLDTMPSMKNILHTEPLFEAMALNAIVEEMMDNETKSMITYSNDGSSMSGVGSYVVQSLTINGVQRDLPTMAIFTESRQSIKDLEVTTLKILSAATGHKFSEQEILSKIKFHMTDSTSHNLEVMDLVSEELGIEYVPKTLLCNVHPLMMFQGKMKELCQEIHNSLGNKKITDCFLVDVEFKNESFCN